MCFIIDKKQPDFKIAENDIDCYKVSCMLWRSKDLGICFRPFHRDYFKYTIDIATEKIKLTIMDICGEDAINEGYHSYKSMKTQKDILGSHSFATGKFVIPKGTKYYENESEYVSETLIFKGYIK